jgi:hypothetical protein
MTKAFAGTMDLRAEVVLLGMKSIESRLANLIAFRTRF